MEEFLCPEDPKRRANYHHFYIFRDLHLFLYLFHIYIFLILAYIEGTNEKGEKEFMQIQHSTVFGILSINREEKEQNSFNPCNLLITQNVN